MPVEVVDTIGAGDAFGAASLAWLHDRDALDPRLSLSELDLESLLKFMPGRIADVHSLRSRATRRSEMHTRT